MQFRDAVELLSSHGVQSAAHDAREIFIRFGGFSRSEIIPPTASSDELLLISAIERRCEREPLQYIVGEVGFYREVYSVSPDCLIPREDTEVLVDYAVKNLPSGARFLDLCTGSGCVAISTLNNTKDTTAVATDISLGALDMAKKNAERCGVSDRLTLRHSDARAEREAGLFDAILSNPPYVSQEEFEALEPELYFEPKGALVAKDDGAEFYKTIIPTHKDSLKRGGFFAFEIGATQAPLLSSLAEIYGMSLKVIRDLSGNDRVAVLTLD
ncbi:MAG: peptide chain release factor N(5)-glutamine methyltransferase [Clostridia bacterium]|nr:peptide chain release factor N(5)-glutamine methyltransferase [Clostridia bacterium]